MTWQDWEPRIGETAARRRRFMMPLAVTAGLFTVTSTGFLVYLDAIPDDELPPLAESIWLTAAFGGLLFTAVIALSRRELAAHAADRELRKANGGERVVVPRRVLARRTAFDSWTAEQGIRWAEAGGRCSKRRRHRATWGEKPRIT